VDQLSPFIKSVLEQPGSVLLPGNFHYLKDFIGAGGRVQCQPSGHLVFYGPENRRFLMTDPEGHPLHECEWRQTAEGQTCLGAARLHLEWGGWVGLRPEGLVNSTLLDLSTRPGWERLTRDDLRMMAARVMNVSNEQIRFFYSDEDLVIDQSGRATIRQRKDAFYVLHEGRFEGAKFMSCMSRMHWERIDYLPVVELFLSLLPGTGSATFELIRGLYDDQNPSDPLPLHYRGIPVYPSEGAFRLFSQFFTGSVPESSKNPLTVFLDPIHSEEVFWLPCVDPPLRYFDPTKKLCLTVKQGVIQKATLADDPSGLSYFRSLPQGIAPYGQSVAVHGANLVFSTGEKTMEFPINSSWGVTSQPKPDQSPKTFPTWHQLFPEGSPNVLPGKAFSTTLLYPDDERVIGEIESQPFAMDYFDDLLDENPGLKAHMNSANHILISQCDAAIGSCLRYDRQRNVTILYSNPQLAQKQAQNLWNTIARSQKLNWIDSIGFLPHSQHWQTCLSKSFDMVFLWVPFAHFQDHQTLGQTTHEINTLLPPGGIAFIVGPSLLPENANRYHLELIYGEYVEALPTFRLHKAILPKARVHPDLMVFVFRKNR
jgi:hypothetical protein